jgi:uncharacterized protein YndB with AHSA1/START domain
MNTPDYDWSKFCLRVPLHADAQKIYDAWAKPAHIEKWFLRNAAFTKPDHSSRDKKDHVQKNDSYQWMWFGYPDEICEKGKILDANGKDFFQFSFAGNCTVTIRIKKEEGETIAELTQDNIPVDEKSKINYHIGCMKGWTFYLANLKSVLEEGKDLRNRNEKLTEVINA